jgi:hypothetical protein
MPVRIWIYRGDFFFTESIGLIEDVRTRRFVSLSTLFGVKVSALFVGFGLLPGEFKSQ